MKTTLKNNSSGGVRALAALVLVALVLLSLQYVMQFSFTLKPATTTDASNPQSLSTVLSNSVKATEQSLLPESSSVSRFSVAQKQRIVGAIWGSFAQDAIGLSYHWVYNQRDIPAHLPASPQKPLSNFHDQKKAGEFTMYGDEQVALLRSLKDAGKWDLNNYASHWRKIFGEGYRGWQTHVAKKLLKSLNAGKAPSEITQISVEDSNSFGNQAPLLLVSKDVEEFVAASKEHSRLTHASAKVMLEVEYFSRVLWDVVMNDASPAAALRSALEHPSLQDQKIIKDTVHEGLGSASQDSVKFIKDHGQTCDVSHGFPTAIHLMAKYPRDFKAAIEANIKGGGDSTGRGMIVGAVLGAHNGKAAIPETWRTGLVFTQEIEDLLNHFN